MSFLGTGGGPLSVIGFTSPLFHFSLAQIALPLFRVPKNCLVWLLATTLWNPARELNFYVVLCWSCCDGDDK